MRHLTHNSASNLAETIGDDLAFELEECWEDSQALDRNVTSPLRLNPLHCSLACGVFFPISIIGVLILIGGL